MCSATVLMRLLCTHPIEHDAPSSAVIAAEVSQARPLQIFSFMHQPCTPPTEHDAPGSAVVTVLTYTVVVSQAPSLQIPA